MDFDPTTLTIGDLVTHGSFVVEDNPDYRVTLTRHGDEMHITTDYKNVAAVLKANHEKAMEFNATGRLGTMVQVASIPTGIYHQWRNEGITNDVDLMKRRLNDADYQKFRTNDLKL